MFDAFTVSNLTSEWQKFETLLSPSQDAENLNNTFRVNIEGSADDEEEVHFALFSLFPPTYKDRENGLRIDREIVSLPFQLARSS
jgi:alpha-N-arabinofuranosidase